MMAKDAIREEDLITFTGTVENVIYENEDTGYAVLDLSSDQTDEILTAAGILPQTSVGEKLTVTGSWTLHPTYGRQFRVAYYNKQLPATENEILRYLSGRAVKGIGPKTAEKLVAKYGEDTFDVIENHPDWLAQIPGITLAKASEISESFRSQYAVRALMMYCRQILSGSMAVRIAKKWGSGALDRIKANPYCLCEEFSGIGFERADQLAREVGIEPESPMRLASGLRYILSQVSREMGHAFLPYDKLIPLAANKLAVAPEKVEAAAGAMIAEKKLIRASAEGLDAVYDSHTFQTEREIEDKLLLLDRICPRLDTGDVERFILRIELEEDKQYAALQRQAIHAAVNHGVMVLTGGPGTGKTTVIRALIRIFEAMDLRIALAAPTGRAAKRMSEATGCEARTIHRLLEVEFSDEERAKFKRGAEDLLEEDVIIIDEASMIDMFLMNALLKAIKPGAHVLFIGDSDQLPSVGAGNVLADLLSSEMFCSVRLTEIFRQAGESLIITNAHRINSGEMPLLNVKDNDFFFLPRENDRQIADTIVGLWQTRLPRTYGEAAAEGIQVISPSRRGMGGVDHLNAKLQQALNPPSPTKREKAFREITFREGDRVMQIKNDYDLVWEKDGKEGVGVFNGDIGVIETINTGAEQMVIRFDERVVAYEFAKLEELEHAWAITVHKSQGSEYPIVILPVYEGCPYQLRWRNLLYTAVTRAKKMVILVGRPEIVSEMVQNNRQILRYTGLFRLGE